MDTDTVGNYNYKVCAICRDIGTYSIYFLNFDSDSAAIDEFIEKQPNIRIIVPEHYFCFCVLDKSLYMFEDSGNIDPFSGEGVEGLSTYILDLTPHYFSKSDDGFVIDSSKMLEQYRGPGMNSPKWDPCAIPTPDGKKILVCSMSIRYYFEEYEEIQTKRRDFEVFDPSNGTWTLIPQLVVHFKPKSPSLLYVRDESGNWIPHYGSKKDCCVRMRLSIGVTFIGNSNTFIVGFPMGVAFTFNLDSPQEGWKEIDGKIQAGDRFFVDGVRLNPFTASRGDVDHTFAIPRHYDYPRRWPYQCMTMLEYGENRKCIPCIVTSWMNNVAGIAYLACDLFKVDTKMLAHPIRVGCFKYVIHEEVADFYVNCVFPLEVEAFKKAKEILMEERNIEATESSKKGQGKRESPWKGHGRNVKGIRSV